MFLTAELPKDPARVSIEKSKTILLVVDDEPQVQRLMVRIFLEHFDEVLFASTPEDAERCFMCNRVTHLISDYDLGITQPRGTALVADWRKRYRFIERAVLLTGSQLTETQIPAEVDRYLLKGVDPLELLKALKP